MLSQEASLKDFMGKMIKRKLGNKVHVKKIIYSLLSMLPVLYPALLLQDLLWLIKFLDIFLLFYFIGE